MIGFWKDVALMSIEHGITDTAVIMHDGKIHRLPIHMAPDGDNFIRFGSVIYTFSDCNICDGM